MCDTAQFDTKGVWGQGHNLNRKRGCDFISLYRIFRRQGLRSDMVEQACHPSTWKVEAGESGIQGQHQLQEFKANLSECDASLGYMRPCQKQKTSKQKAKATSQWKT